jgi:BMFP domain-containing protein YqiC
MTASPRPIAPWVYPDVIPATVQRAWFLRRDLDRHLAALDRLRGARDPLARWERRLRTAVVIDLRRALAQLEGRVEVLEGRLAEQADPGEGA